MKERVPRRNEDNEDVMKKSRFLLVCLPCKL